MRFGLITDTHLPGKIITLDELGELPRQLLSSVCLLYTSDDADE